MKSQFIKHICIIFFSFMLIACGSNNDKTTLTTLTAQEKAISKIESYASSNGSSSILTLQDYIDAGVTGLDAGKLADINEVVENLTSTEVDTTSEIQALADALGVNIDTTAPVFTSSNTISVNENQTSAITLVATDASTVTYSISGTDAASFTVDGATGVVAFNAAPDFETKNTYMFTASATDTSNNASTHSVTISILDINETSPNIGKAFKIKVKTDNVPNTVVPPSKTEFEIPISGGISLQYKYNVDCDDDGTDEATDVNSSYTCQYAAPGIYTVSITGDFPGIVLWRTRSAQKLISIEQWGTQVWGTVAFAFADCENMIYNATDKPNLTNITRMSGMFWSAEKFDGSIGDWNVSNVRDMNTLFAGAHVFNQSLTSWDVSNVTSMNGMFSTARIFNQDIGGWNTSRVTDMMDMFQGALAFNQDIGQWDTNKVTTMYRMFQDARSFNQNISSWNVSKVANMGLMFKGTKAFNQSLNAWNVSAVTNMTGMFFQSIFSADISEWSTSRVTNMSRMFEQAFKFNQDIGSWDVGSVNTMERMFTRAEKFNQNLESWDVSSVTNMQFMFNGAIDYSDNNLSNWHVQNVTTHNAFLEGTGSGNIEPNWP